MRERRRKLPPSIVLKASRVINEKIIQTPIFRRAVHIAYYLSDENEVDLSLMAEQALFFKKTLYLPRIIENKRMQFVRVDADTVYEKNRFGILEPQSSVVVDPAVLELMFLSLVVFDAKGNRCGRGAGYYDRYLSQCHGCYSIGVGYAFQEVSRLFPDAWDIPMREVITELGDFIDS